jgi:hypothetical protein
LHTHAWARAGALATARSAFDGAPLEGKVALVAGGTLGIGKGCALALAKGGATVYITGRTMTATDSLTGTAGHGRVSESVIKCPSPYLNVLKYIYDHGCHCARPSHHYV